MTIPAVAVVDLRVSYGDIKAVDGLTMTAPAAAITAVVGRNGQGKTTTIEVCEGLRRPDFGSVRVLGCDPHRTVGLRARVGVMLQDGGIPTMARPAEYLGTLARFYAHPRPVGELLEWLGLTSVARTPYRRLSGGEAQRVKLAAAVIGRPDLVFLDEPSTGLDPAARRGMWELVAALRRDGVAVVLTTHQMSEAETLADHIVVIEAGRALAAGTLAELVGDSDDVLTFNGPMHLDVATLDGVLSPASRVDEPSPGRYRVTGDVTPQTIATVTAWCAQHGVTPRELHVGRRSLEDLFIDLADERDARP